MKLWTRIQRYLLQRHIDHLSAELDAENRRFAQHDNHVEWYVKRIEALKAEYRAVGAVPKTWRLPALNHNVRREQPAHERFTSTRAAGAVQMRPRRRA